MAMTTTWATSVSSSRNSIVTTMINTTGLSVRLEAMVTMRLALAIVMVVAMVAMVLWGTAVVVDSLAMLAVVVMHRRRT